MSPLQHATQFFYDQIGHRIIASAPPEAYAVAQDGECSVCGRHGDGFFDGRPNHRVFRCTQCWSFYWSAPDVFPRTGTEKDFSFAGKIKNSWVLDSTGTLFSPVGASTNKSPEFRAAAARYGLDFEPKEMTPERWLAHQVLSGEFRFPLLWASFGQNKIRSIQAMRVAESVNAIPRAVDGKTIWYDGARIVQAAATINGLNEVDYGKLKSTRWMFDGLPADDLARLRLRRELTNALGLPKAALGLSDDSRGALRQLAAR